MREMRRSLAALLIALLAGPATAAAELELLMIEARGCPWCARWEAEIGGAYALTEEGRAAPLRRARLGGPLPEGVELARPARVTPTFVLLRAGRETGRIEGHPGPDFFYPMLRGLIGEAAR